METPPTYIPLSSIIWYGPWFVLLLIVMLQLLILLLREHMLPVQVQRNQRSYRQVQYEQHDTLVQDVYQVLHGTSTLLSDVEQRLAMIEHMAEQDRATLTDVRDRLAMRSRSTSRKTAREE